MWLPAVPGSPGEVANWPGVWADGQNWPQDGEIDIAEGIGGQMCAHLHNAADPAGVPGGGTGTPGIWPISGSPSTPLDCGLFHIFGGGDRAAYARSLRSVVIPGGRFFLLCFSDAQPPGGWGLVHRVSQGEIKAAFAGAESSTSPRSGSGSVTPVDDLRDTL